MGDMDLDGIVVFAVIGIISTAVVAFVGLPVLAWWLWHHLSWVQ